MKWGWEANNILDLVKNAGGVVKSKTRCCSAAPGGRLQVVLSNELAEVEQYLPVLLPQPQLVLHEAAASALHNLGPLCGADWQVEVVGEGEQEGLGCQLAERALQVKEVGRAPAHVGAVVGDVGEELSAIGRTAQGLLVNIQDGDVATVAGQRVEHAGTHRRRYPVRTDDAINISPTFQAITLTTMGFIHATHS